MCSNITAANKKVSRDEAEPARGIEKSVDVREGEDEIVHDGDGRLS